MKKLKPSDIIFDTANTIFMIFIFIIMLYPFWYVLSYSLSETSQIKGGMMFFPQGFSLDAYSTTHDIK